MFGLGVMISVFRASQQPDEHSSNPDDPDKHSVEPGTFVDEPEIH